MARIEVGILAEFSPSGRVTPKAILWEDGRRFSIDHILDMRRAASLKAGGLGIRYICKVHGKEVMLYKDEDRWFMEVDS